MRALADRDMARPRVGLIAWLACIRYREVLVLQGAPLLGVAFALPEVSLDRAVPVAVFGVASLLLVAHIFTFNDWAGIAADRRDPNKVADVFLTKGVTRAGIGMLSLVLLVGSLGLFALLAWRTLALAAAIAALGIAYSHPRLNAKGTPILSSSPHLLGGVLHFLLGYSLFAPVDRRGVLIALFFALTFTAGHLNQEVRDHDGDRPSGIRTNAVAFGKRATFLAGLTVFTLAYVDLWVLARTHVVPPLLGWVVLGVYPWHVFWSLRTLRTGLSFETVSRLQARYRALYAVIGVAMVISLLAR